MASAITEELVLSAMSGDAVGIEALLRVAQTDIRRYARRSCRNASDVEEAVQETLIILYRKIGGLRQAAAVSGWLFRIVNRYCVRLTLQALGAPYEVEAEAIEQHFAAIPKPELRMDLARAIQSLPDKYRKVVVLRDLEERTIDEICRELSATRESVKARLHRARALLREYLIVGD